MNFDELRNSPSAVFGKGATIAEIEAAQQRLGVLFPASLTTFLLKLGWGGVGDSEVFGLGADVPDFLNLVKAAEQERPAPHLVPLANDGWGNLYCLDSNSPEGAVVFWNHEDQALEPVAPSFLQWLDEQFQESLAGLEAA